MNVYIVVGVALVAIGTLVTIIGTQRQSREESEQTNLEVRGKIDKTYQALEELSSAAVDSETQENIASIEAEFRNWASEFISDRERRFNLFSQLKLASTQNEIELSDEIRPFAQELVRLLNGFGTALAESGERVTDLDFPTLPVNLFSEYECYIEFDTGVRLLLATSGRSPVANTPNFVIDFDTMDSKNRNDFLIMRLENDEIGIIVVGSKIPSSLFPETIPRNPSSTELSELARQIVELQLYLLEPP